MNASAIIFFGLGAVAVVTTLGGILIWVGIERAPLAEEDETGFHVKVGIKTARKKLLRSVYDAQLRANI